jgi:diaminopimelate decarboxylase
MSVTHTSPAADWGPLLNAAADTCATPSYVVRWQPIADAVAVLDRLARPGLRVRSWLSVKTHPVAPLIDQWVRTGRGVEVVSEHEFLMAERLGVPVEQLLVNGVAKHAWLPRYPRPGLRVHFDSPAEVAALAPLARSAQWRVGVRCHAPDEADARDPRFGGQFGMTAAEAVAALSTLTRGGCLVEGIHFHLGQKTQRAGAYTRGVDHAARICAEARVTPRYVDMGGALPARTEADDALRDLAQAIDRAGAVFGAPLQEVWLENGRFITEASTALLVRVLDVKERDDSRYLICDGGRTNHALAADRGAHPLVILPPRSGAPRLTTICGPTCMTDDVLVRAPLPGDIAPGDLIAWMNAGAYHLPWETRFSHGLCAVVWVGADGTMTLARAHESPASWATRWRSTAA